MSMRNARSLWTSAPDALSVPDSLSGLGTAREHSADHAEAEADEFDDLLGDLLRMLGLLAFIGIAIATLTLLELVGITRRLLDH